MPSSNTVTFHLTAPDPDFLYKLALPIADAVPAGTPAQGAAPAAGHRPVHDRADRREARRGHGSCGTRASASGRLPRSPTASPTRSSSGSGTRGAERGVQRGRARHGGHHRRRPDQTWSPALASTLRTRYSSHLHHDSPAGTAGALAEHEAAAVRRHPGAAGAQLRRRPQPSDRARRRPGRRAGRLPAAAAEHRRLPALLPLHGATRTRPEPTTAPTWPRRGGSWRRPARRESRSPSGSTTSRSASVNGAYIVSVLRRPRVQGHAQAAPAQGLDLAVRPAGRRRRRGRGLPVGQRLLRRWHSRAGPTPPHPHANFNVGRVLQPPHRRRDGPRPRAPDERPVPPRPSSGARSTARSPTKPRGS